MLYLSHTPAQPISDFVDYLWSLSDVPPHAEERILPSGTLELVVNLHENEFRIYDRVHPEQFKRLSGAIVSGAYGGFYVIDTREHASVIGVHFRPGGALPFLGIPAGALADSHVDLETLWGHGAVELRERLCTAETAEERFHMLEKALVDRLSGPLKRHGAVQFALEQLGRNGATISGLAERLELSHRRLIEVFTCEVGMTPKLFGRVRRFQRALTFAQQVAAPDWGRLAAECGYFDQSHLIREFSAFSGFSPAELLRHRNDRMKENHVALPERSNSSKTRSSAPVTFPANGGRGGTQLETTVNGASWRSSSRSR